MTHIKPRLKKVLIAYENASGMCSILSIFEARQIEYDKLSLSIGIDTVE